MKKHNRVMVKSTTIMVESDTKALRRCGLTMTLMVDHDTHKLTLTVVNLPWSLSDR